MSLMIKIMLLQLALILSAPSADKTQWFLHAIFNSTLQLINDITSDLPRLLRYFNSTKIVVFLKIPYVLIATVFSNNLALYLKDSKLSEFTISLLRLVASSLEKTINYLWCQDNLNYVLTSYILT